MTEIRPGARRQINRWVEEASALTPEETATAAAELIMFAGVGRHMAEAFIEGLVTERDDDNALEFLDHLRSVAHEKWPEEQ